LEHKSYFVKAHPLLSLLLASSGLSLISLGLMTKNVMYQTPVAGKTDNILVIGVKVITINVAIDVCALGIITIEAVEDIIAFDVNIDVFIVRVLNILAGGRGERDASHGTWRGARPQCRGWGSVLLIAAFAFGVRNNMGGRRGRLPDHRGRHRGGCSSSAKAAPA
jgi:hypothetical protein